MTQATITMNDTIQTCINNHIERKTRITALNEKLYAQLKGDDVDWSQSTTLRKYDTYLKGTNIERLLDNAIIENEYKKIRAEQKKNKGSNKIKIPRSWKNNINEFAQDALGITLHQHQIELCESKAKTNILIAGRGAGKSTAAQVKAIHKAVTNPKHTVLVVSSGQRMSSDFGEKLLSLIRESEVMDWVKQISKETVTFHNGSTLHLLPANPDTIRGYHPKHGETQNGITAILDEACFMDQGSEIRTAIEYALITAENENGQLLIVSSPTSTSSWVHELVQKADDSKADTKIFHCTSSANLNISQEEIERLKATKNEAEFRAEVLGEWVNGAFGLFAGIIEQNIIKDKEIPKEAFTSLGADLAISYNATQDKNVLAVAAKWFNEKEDQYRYRIMRIEILEHASDKEIRETADQLADKYNITTATVEQYQGKSLAEHCQENGIETNLIAATSNQQRMVFHEVHRLLRQKLLELPNSLPKEFFHELENFEYRMEQNGNITFGHPAAKNQHDDTVYAMAWAIHALAFNFDEQKHQPKTQAPFLIQFAASPPHHPP